MRCLRWLASILTHPQHAIDLSTFLNQESLRVHVTMNHARRLELDSLLGVDGTANLSADDRFAAHHVAFHFPAPRDQDLLGRADCAVDGPFNFYDAVGGNVAHYAHPGADD